MKSLRKKGMAVVSWILLLGFAVALATTIALWQMRQTEELSQATVRFVSGQMECENIQFGVESSEGCSSLTITNKGFFDIDQFSIRVFSNLGADAIIDETSLPVKESTNLNVGLVNAETVKVTPIVLVSSELVGCKDKTIEITCRGLSEIQRFTCEQAEVEGKCGELEELGIVTCEECCAEDYCCEECPI